MNKEYKSLGPLISAFKTYKNIIDNIESSKELLAEEKELALKIKKGDEIAKEKFITSNLRLVVKLAHDFLTMEKVVHPTVCAEDICKGWYR